MKKLVLTFAMVLFANLFVSCTDNTEEILDNGTKTQKITSGKIDPEKVCPPNDRNCNGVPDDQE